MPLNKLIGDELYQINLILWMLQPSKGIPVKPLLAQAGFRIKDIEVELPLPVSLKNRLAANHIAVSDPVTPDIVMARKGGEYVLAECKKSMFGSGSTGAEPSSQIKQARSLLLQIPRILESALGLHPGSVVKSSVVYLSREDSTKDQLKGIKEIDSALGGAGYETAACGLLVLRVQNKEIVASAEQSDALGGTMKDVFGKGVVVHSVQDDETDPRPLYIVPWMPGGSSDSDDYGQAVFGNRVLAAAAACIGLCRPACDVEVGIDELLSAATQGHFKLWKKKSVRKALRSNVKKLIEEVLKKFAPDIVADDLIHPGQGWKISIPDDRAQSMVVEGFRKWQAQKWNERPVPLLFDKEDTQ